MSLRTITRALFLHYDSFVDVDQSHLRIRLRGGFLSIDCFRTLKEQSGHEIPTIHVAMPEAALEVSPASETSMARVRSSK